MLRLRGGKLAGGFRLAIALVASCCAVVLGYMAGIRQTNAGAGAPQKTYEIKFSQLNLHLTAGT